jgi:hypothetical protein
MMEDLKSLMYDSQVDFEAEASKDFERFTDIGSSSPRSQASGRSGKTSFREMVNESFDHYRRKVMQVTVIYKYRTIRYSNQITITRKAFLRRVYLLLIPMILTIVVLERYMIEFLVNFLRRILR